MPPKPRKSTPEKRKPTTGGGPSRNLVIGLVVAALVVAALVVGTVVLTDGDSDNTTTTGSGDLIQGLDQSNTVLGNPAATVTLVQYEDLQCPICKQYTDDAFPTLVEEYVKPGKVKVDFRGLSFIGPDSVKALKVSLAAGKQNKLWDVVEAFYANQGTENTGWVTDELVDQILAGVPGLDAEKVLADAKTPEIAAEVEKLTQEGNDRGVQGTPTFFIKIGDQDPYEIQPESLTPEAFRPALDDALSGQ